MPVEVRVLGPGDEQPLEEFLRAHAESSMILRSNVCAAGLVDRGAPYQGTYAAAFEADRVVAVACHSWRGGIVLQAPVHLWEVVRCAIAGSGRAVSGIFGPWTQVVAARKALGLAEAPTLLASREILYALALADLVVPAPLATGAVSCRRPLAEELAALAEWRVAYNVETNGRPDTEVTRAQSREEVTRWHADRQHFVLTRAGERVAYCAFNAWLPDMVQVGGVFTPAALRSRGYGRAVVAGSLRIAHEEAAERAILFTGEENRPAQRAYEALGFRPVGDYGLVSFR